MAHSEHFKSVDSMDGSLIDIDKLYKFSFLTLFYLSLLVYKKSEKECNQYEQQGNL